MYVVLSKSHWLLKYLKKINKRNYSALVFGNSEPVTFPYQKSAVIAKQLI